MSEIVLTLRPIQTRSALLFAVLLPLLFASCGGRKVHTAKPPRIGGTESGVASWYGPPYHGRRAANGEVYDMEKMTAAHRTLPFDTWVSVRNLNNNKHIEVRIQDRGPFIRGRIIDLSKAAAREIDMLGPGTAKVKLTIIKPPKRSETDRQPELFTVQVGAFRDRSRAEAIRNAMQSQYGEARIVERSADGVIYRVLVGREEEEAKAEALAARIRAVGTSALVVRLDSEKP
ncbi:MAG: septal ring lytic transglycosylase RlpA family protein [Bryobacteraceae bacterium]|nr:septal ring lytic transglycosylase RlpA family protein [Bryobacteraceae bacterium]